MTAMNITTTATNFAKVVALSSLLVVAGATQSRAGEGDVLGLLIGSAVLGTLLSFSGGLYDTTPYYRAERRHRHHRRHHQPYYRAERRHHHHRRHHHSRHAAPAYRSYDAPTYVSYDAPAYAPAYLPSPAPIQQTVVYDQYPNDYCREYESLVTINGVSQRSHGIACYRPDGSWRIIQ